MDIPFELHIALRYLLAKRKQAFISVISLISTLGVTVGVMALIIALALMTGLQQELRDKILGSNPHVFVWKRGGMPDYAEEVARMRQLPHVVGAAPAILGKALISSGGEQAFINVKGIDLALEPSVTDIAGAMRKGSLPGLVSSDPDASDGILLGSDLASQLRLEVGDTITVMTPQGTLSPMGLIPRQRRFRVAGTFTLGLYEVDSQTGFVTLDVARRLFDKDDIDAVQLRLDDVYVAPELANDITLKYGEEYVAQDWADMNQPLFSALWLEKMAISLTIGLIVMVAALNIVASLILLVMEKHRDIAILKTMGASARSVTFVFMMQGVIIGLVGTVLGAIVVCFFATIYPSRQAARLDPVQALRYE